MQVTHNILRLDQKSLVAATGIVKKWQTNRQKNYQTNCQTNWRERLADMLADLMWIYLQHFPHQICQNSTNISAKCNGEISPNLTAKIPPKFNDGRSAHTNFTEI